MKFSLVIPCYNEEKNLTDLVSKCQQLREKIDCEIIFVNNGSTDSTQSVLETLTQPHQSMRIVHVLVNQGYGYGILSGLEAARSDILAWCHADLQTDPADAISAMTLFGNTEAPETLFVKGLRKKRSLSDTAFTVGMSIFESLLFGQKLWDINAQPTMFHRKFYADLKDAPHDFSIDLFFYACAKKQGLTVKRVPVFFPERLHGHSSWNLDFGSKVKFIKRTIKFSFELKSRFRGERFADH